MSVPITPRLGSEKEDYFDRADIERLVRWERYCRDQGRFDELAECYTADSRVRVSWFSGTGAAFAEASRQVSLSGFKSYHLIFPMRIELGNDRALCESYGSIQAPNAVAGIPVFLVSHVRFLSRLRRTTTGWKMMTLDCIYEFDEIATINRADALPVCLMEAAGKRTSYRFLNAMGTALGYCIDQEMAGDDRPDLVRTMYIEADSWLARALS